MKDKSNAMPQGTTKQDGPSTTKTLGDMIREALEKAAKPDFSSVASSKSEPCGCAACCAERGDEVPEASLEMGVATISAAGNHIKALYEQENDKFVLSFEGPGADFVASNDGKAGIRFNTPQALQEFFDFVTVVEMA